MLADKEVCCGCGSCSEVCPRNCISMQRDTEGFLYPVLDKANCINCGLCNQACPVINKPAVSEETIAFAVKNNDETVRSDSSSGGCFSLLAEYILNQNGIIYGATYDREFKVVHKRIESGDELHELRGAKYAQSESFHLFSEIRNDLNHDRYVLFTGTPCQVSALKQYLSRDYEKLILADIVCHGVPSPLVWKKYLAERQRKDAEGSSINAVNQRNKVSGWSRYSYSVEIEYENHESYCVSQGRDIFMRGFVNNLYLRPSCSSCSFKGYNRCSDFTLGDCWGIWDFKPEFDDNKGTSLVMVHTKKAHEIWNQLSDKCTSCELSENDAVSQNPSILVSSASNQRREEFFNGIDNHDSVCEWIGQCLQSEQKSRFRRLLNSVKKRIKA